MHRNTSDLPAQISSRICHDLASPLGAIANGLELLELSGAGTTPETALIQESVDAARARLEFFRVAYGRADPDASVAPRKLQNTLQNNFRERRISTTWDAAVDTPRPVAKLLFLLVQCAEPAMPRGGEVSVSSDGAIWRITCTTAQIKPLTELWELLQHGTMPEELAPGQVQFALARAQAEELSFDVAVDEAEAVLRIVCTPR